MNRNGTAGRRSWRQEPMVWMLIAVPVAAVIMGIVTLTLAIRSYDGLVSDDYYKHGLEINRAIERDQRALQLDLEAGVELLGAGGQVRVVLRGNRDFAAPRSLNLKFAYALRGRDDQDVVLEGGDGSQYSAGLPALAPGRWYLHLSGADWRLNGAIQLPEETRARLTATR